MPKQMTNLECLADIMNFSRHGALAQAFVMDALSKHAARIARMSPGELKHQFGEQPMISAEA